MRATILGKQMILTTGDSVSGQQVSAYLGIVSGEAIVGANILRDFFASITDIVGGRSGAYEGALRDAKDTALREMTEQAKRLGATAVIGIDIDYESISMKDGGNMLMVAVSGTAIRF